MIPLEKFYVSRLYLLEIYKSENLTFMLVSNTISIVDPIWHNIYKPKPIQDSTCD